MLGGNKALIRKGKLVSRLSDKYCTSSLNIELRALRSRYPAEGDVGIVCRGPYEADFGDQDIMYPARQKNHLILKKAIDVVCEGSIYERCMVTAFYELKA